MHLNDYAEVAMETEANQDKIADRIIEFASSSLTYVRLNNGITGLTDEVGELAAAKKKWIEYGQDLDKENIKEEVGDCLWRLAQICKACDFTMGQAARANINKLQKHRYKDGYSDEAAKEENRDRINEASVMRSKDELTEEEILAYNKSFSSEEITGGVGGIRLVKLVNPLPIQTGQGFAEPPEDELTEQDLEIADLEVDNFKLKKVWEETAKTIAGLCEGQDHSTAMKMIERAKEQTK
tara:strand:+ start:5254 stop:5970 length:717 start_codon:yes stop_codon:yes gene_type:complete